MLNFADYEALTFDCYGTLINWDAGIRDALAPILAAHGVRVDDERLLALYAEEEARLESGDYCEYKAVLKGALQGIGARLGFAPTPEELQRFADSIRDWQPFADTVEALQALARRYQLVIISNTDDDLFATTQKHLQTAFSEVITAEQARSYKPSANNFQRAIERLGLPKERVLHVAQSVFHDIIPANRLGLATVWVNRRGEANRWLAEEPRHAQAKLEVADLRSLAQLAGLL